ncbi:MAG: polysaccharide biosynthesis tyrosine autokinase [Chloroflexales bacterium]|nr:polysaccharide biosynthesis tyrosine autokinase [Chloroflexales bacterium]
MELKVYLRFVWRWLWLIALLTVIGGTLGFLDANKETRMYQATAKLLVNQDQGRFAAPSPTLEDLRARERFSLTVMEVMRTRTVLSEVLANLGLENDISLGMLLGRVTTEAIGGTEVFKLQVQDPDRERAILLVGEIVRVFQKNERTLLDNPFAQASSLIIVEQPYAGFSPISPNIPRSAILAAVIGILLAVLIGFLRDYFDDSMGGGGDMERRTRMTPLAEIGSISGLTPAARLITRSDPFAPDAETYRMFRGFIDNFPLERSLQALAVTSPEPRAGTSLSVANLAVALAQTSRRVVLVDANLRRPTLHEYFGMGNETGLSSLLSSDGEHAGAYLRPTGVENLRLLTAGPANLLPAQLIGSGHFAALVERLRAEADLVLFDTPSLLSVVDTAILVEHVDAVLLVARATPAPIVQLRRLIAAQVTPATSADMLQQAFDQLQQSKTNILGILLNDVRGRRPMGRYYSQLRQRVTRRAAGAVSGENEGRVTVERGTSRLASGSGD